MCCFFFQAEDGIRDLVRSRGLGDVYKRQVLTDGGGNSFTSSSGSNNTSQTWNNVSRLLDAPPYSIQFFDEDVVSQDDDLGTFNIPAASNGTVPFALGNGTYGSLIIALQPQQVFTDSDTVRVFPAPQLTTFYDTASATLCATDTMQLVYTCLLYTSDAADERSSVDLGGRRIIKKKKRDETRIRSRRTQIEQHTH